MVLAIARLSDIEQTCTVVSGHSRAVKNLIATVDEDFAKIDHLLRELRERIARAAEAVHIVAEKAAHTSSPRKRRRRAVKGR
jgi:hypothetical protein